MRSEEADALVKLLAAGAGFLGVVVIGLAGVHECGDAGDFPDGFLEDVQDVLGIEAVFLGLRLQSDKLFSHLL